MASRETIPGGKTNGTICMGNVAATETEDAIVFNWDAKEDVEYYKIELERSGDEVIKQNSTDPKYEFKHSIYFWKIGELIHGTVRSVDKPGTETTLLCEFEYAVGGDAVATRVVAETDPNCPHSGILLKWEQPKNKPLEYEITVFKERSKKKKQLHICQETQITIEGLRQCTEYHCEVSAKYNGLGLGKSTKSNVVKTWEKPTTGVKVWKDQAYPARNIVVNWEEIKPDFKVFSKFHVFLQPQANDASTKTETKELGDGRQTVFKRLKSGTAYTACVVAFSVKGKKETFYSQDEIVTDSVERSEGFDIIEAGKPMILSCQPESVDGKLTSDFSWKHANLQNENLNYELLHTTASYKVGNSIRHPLRVKDDGNSADPIKLAKGKKYSFRVTCSYRDLDTFKEFEAVSEGVFNTEIGKPVIDNVTWKNEEITVNWTPAEGAVDYRIRVFNETKIEVVNHMVKLTSHSFSMSNNCTYGRICIFEIEAMQSQCKTTKDSKEVLIGGDKAVTKAVATKDVLNPRRGIKVSWKKPRMDPKLYKLALYEQQPQQNSQHQFKIIKVKETGATEYKFEELKSMTTYSCKIFPKYNDTFEGGTLSCLAATDKRLSRVNANQKNFGASENITADLITKGSKVEAKLWWARVEMGENYKLLRFVVEVVQKGYYFRTFSSEIFRKEVEANCNEVCVPDIKMGYEYVVKVKTMYIDLDIRNETEAIKEHKFNTKPSETKVLECTCENGSLHFTWAPVDGAVRYTLLLKDANLESSLAADYESRVTEQNNGCYAKLPMSEKLGIGKTCMAKVRTHTSSELTSDSEWKTYLIGGSSVPRNVKADIHSQNPRRSVQITFEAPEKGLPNYYEIVSTPVNGGRKKTQIFKTSPAIFEYLRQGIQYTFAVSAVCQEVRSQESTSNKITTYRGDDNKPMNEFSATGGEYNFQHSKFEDNTTKVNIVRGEDFGRVRDVRVPITEKDDCDMLSLEWNVPSFDNRASDYKVEEYQVRIQSNDNKEPITFPVKFEKDKHRYLTEKIRLELDSKYEINITTVYEDIDRDVFPLFSSATKLPLYTRPSKPKVTINSWKNDELLISWNPVKGEVWYELEIFTESPQNRFRHTMGKKVEWRTPLAEQIGYGMSYYVIVTAHSHEKSNFFKTTSETIGGSYVPRNVIASNKCVEIVEPNTQIFLKWDEPMQKPSRYEVEADPKVDSQKPLFEGSTCLVSGLKAGTIYRFKVAAIHEIDGRERKSGASLSNEVKTDPKPTQVKNVKTFLSENPSSCRKVVWDKVDAEKDNESTIYRVTVCKEAEQESEEYKQEIKASNEEVMICGLDPGSSYKVTVAGGNSDGYGRDSEEVSFPTEYGTPHNCRLKLCHGSPSTSLVLQFQEAVGKPDEYRAVLYKSEHERISESTTESVVQQGHIYNNLMANTRYFVKIHGIFGGKEGKTVESSHIKTAASRSCITEYGHVNELGKGSRDLFVQWKSDHACMEHEVMVKRGKSEEVECRIRVKNENKLRYTCQLEAMGYVVQVRSKNEAQFYGPWSEPVSIELAPAKLQDVIAKLDHETNDIIVTSKVVERESVFYYVQVICDEKNHGIPTECEVKGGEGLVEYRLKNPIPAQRYAFMMWPQNSLKIKGESSISNSVISRAGPVTLRTVARSESNPTTDIQITWESHDRCDSYELMISIVHGKNTIKECLARYPDTSCVYRCKSPGDKYAVSVRALRNFVLGEWSPDQCILLAPQEVVLVENDGSDTPTDCLEINWKLLEVTPDGYLVTLYEGNDKIDECKVDSGCTKHTFKNKLKPGSLCHCTVAAFNAEAEGKPAKSRMYRIAWSKPSYFDIVLDQNDPSRKAKMTWDKPYGVNCFKLQIENIHTGLVKTIEQKEQSYAFLSGIPGNSYTLKLYCGCDSRYDSYCEERHMTMDPDAPYAITASANRNAKGLLVEFKDNWGLRKVYEVTAKPMNSLMETKCIKTEQNRVLLKDLIPGESYSLAVSAIIGDTKSREICLDGYVETIPDEVRSLRSYEQNGVIVFEWDSVKVPPNEYIVQWRVGNEPITEEQTTDTKFEIFFKKPAHCYSARVTGCNSSGMGKMTAWTHFISDPSPPRCVQVYPDPQAPETSLIVKFQDEEDSLKRYRIVAEGPEDQPKTVITHENFAIFSELQPGRAYLVKVQTLFCGKESTWAHFSRIRN